MIVVDIGLNVAGFAEILPVCDRIFSLEKETAFEEVSEHIAKAPKQLSAFIKASNGRVNTGSLEPPLEKASDFREFITQTESYIKKFLMD